MRGVKSFGVQVKAVWREHRIQ